MFSLIQQHFESGSLRQAIDGSLSAVLLAVSGLYYVGGAIAIVLKDAAIGA